MMALLSIWQEEMEEDGEESAPAEDLFSEIHLGQLKKVSFDFQLKKVRFYLQPKKVWFYLLPKRLDFI